MSGKSALLVRVLRQKFARFTLAHLATSCPTMGRLVFTSVHHPLTALGERCGCAKRFLSRCDCKRFKRSMKGFCGERAGVSRVSCYIFHVELSQKTNFWLIVARGVSALEISLFVLRTLSLYCNEFLKPVKTEHIQRIIIYLKQNSIYF